MVSKPSLTWVHVSDLHFGHGDAHYHFDQIGVTSALLRDATDMCKRLGPPDLLIVTGDVAFSGQPAQYQQAKQWLQELQNQLGGHARILVVPGNHDIDRKHGAMGTGKMLHAGLRHEPGLLDELIKDPVKMDAIWPKMQAYSDFAKVFEGCGINPVEPFWSQELPSLGFRGKVIVCGLNTALLCSDEQDAPTNLRLGRGQLLRVIEKQPSDALLFVLQHHPPEWLLDGSELTALLEQRAHIQFSGHIHRQQGFAHAALGSGARIQLVAGASHAASSESGHHAYAWGRLDGEGLAYYSRVWSPTLRGFAPAVMLDTNEFKRDSHAFISLTRLPTRLADCLSPTAQSPVSVIAPGANTLTTRNKVFISYSHKDEKYLDELITHLKPLERAGVVTKWSDKDITVGSKWLDEIKAALANTEVAVLLVSRNFLASDFIDHHELGPLLRKAAADGIRILWIPVGACNWELTPLKDYQAAISPDISLAEMSKGERDRAWVKVCKEIIPTRRDHSPNP